MLKFNEQQMLLISFVLLVQFASPGNGMGTGRSFHLKRRRVNPPAVDEATSLWYEIVIPPPHSSSVGFKNVFQKRIFESFFFKDVIFHIESHLYAMVIPPRLTLLQPIIFCGSRLPLAGQLQTGLRQAAAADLSADQRASNGGHPLVAHHAHILLPTKPKWS